MENKKKLSFEDLGATPEDFDNAKIRISIMIPVNDLLELKRLAGINGKKYQPLIQEILHTYIQSQKENITVLGGSEIKMLLQQIREREIENARETVGVKKELKEIRNLMKHNMPIVNGPMSSLRAKKAGR